MSVRPPSFTAIVLGLVVATYLPGCHDDAYRPVGPSSQESTWVRRPAATTETAPEPPPATPDAKAPAPEPDGPPGTPISKDSVLMNMPASCDESRIYFNAGAVLTPAVKKGLLAALAQLVGEAKKDAKNESKERVTEAEGIARMIREVIESAQELAACRTRLDSGSIFSLRLELPKGQKASDAFVKVITSNIGEPRDRDVIDGVTYLQMPNKNWTAFTADKVIFGRGKEGLVKAVNGGGGEKAFRGALDYVGWMNDERNHMRIRAKADGDKYEIVIARGGDTEKAQDEFSKLRDKLKELGPKSPAVAILLPSLEKAVTSTDGGGFTVSFAIPKSDVDHAAARLKDSHIEAFLR